MSRSRFSSELKPWLLSIDYMISISLSCTINDLLLCLLIRRAHASDGIHRRCFDRIVPSFVVPFGDRRQRYGTQLNVRCCAGILLVSQKARTVYGR